jgi:heterodisulfide reductase subunit A
MIECDRHKNITLLTYSEVKEVKGYQGNFKVRILNKPRFVEEEKCTGCGECTVKCPVEVPNEFDMGLGSRKIIYRPFPQAIPKTFAIDKRGTPKCRASCPAGVNVQAYIALIKQGKYREALEVIRRNNPLPLVCGRICFHPCETNCERSNIDEPVSINALKRFLTSWELKHNKYQKVDAIPKIYNDKVAIIGSGPAGLTAAFELVKKGYPVTIFESSSKLGGTLRIGIPDYRLPKKLLDIEIKRITDLGVEIQTGITIGKDIQINQLKQKDYKAFFVATGALKNLKLGIPGEDKNNVIYALDFLKTANLRKNLDIKEKVAVIGGGNVAIDAARTALRLGSSDVCILYRRSEIEMPAFSSEVENAEKEGIKFQFLVSPIRILDEKGKVTGLKCIRTKLGIPDDGGRRRPIPIDGSEFILDFDLIIVAIGQVPDLSFLPNNVKVNSKEMIECNPLTLETAVPGIFIGGDSVTGPATVIDAIAAGQKAAVSIDRYLRGKDLREGREIEIKLVGELSKEGIEKNARQIMPCVSIEKRNRNFNEVELGFNEEMAKKEAQRCLECGGCSECLECEKVCEPKAIDHDQKEQITELNVEAIIVATGFDTFNPSGIKEYGYGKYINVLTSMELERMLSASGPTEGKLLKPSDKRIPHKIAFIQCVGSRSLKDNFPYCSTKEGVLIKEHEPHSNISIFYTDIRAFGKGFQQFVNRAEKEQGIKYYRAKPAEIKENPKTKDLLIKFEDTLTGEIKNLEVNLLVLCTPLFPSPENKALADIFNIELTESNYFKVENPLLSPLDSTSKGIFLCGCCQGPKDIPDSIAQAKGAAARAVEFISLKKPLEVV